MTIRLILGLLVTAAAAGIVGHRALWLARLVLSGAPIPPERRPNVLGAIKAQITDVFAQRKLFKVRVAGTAHAFTFWGFVVLLLTIIEAYGSLFDRDFFIPVIGRSRALGLIEDIFATAVLIGIITFVTIRIARSPRRLDRKSRFYGSHVDQAFVVLGMIFLVIATLVLYRGAQLSNGYFPYQHDGWWPFASKAVSYIVPGGIGFETTFVVAQIAVVMAFGVFLLYGKHMHIVTAPLNASMKRHPKALGSLGTTPDLEKLMEDENAVLGVGQIEHLHHQQLLQTLACTECGRCQDKCPAWNTGKPLNPKLIITALRDQLFRESDRLIGAQKAGAGSEDQAAEPTMLVPDVIDPDVLWSCTTCGACVAECPVDIEHVDAIVDLRRFQVMSEAVMPEQAAGMLRNVERRGDPFGVGAAERLAWAEGLDFEIPVVTDEIDEGIEYLFWIGCAGAHDARARRTVRAVATLLHQAGVRFAVLGPRESCTGDPARRLGNEFLYEEQAKKNIATFEAARVRRIVTTCPHCLNSIGSEYPALGGHYEVVHHAQLLAELVGAGRFPLGKLGAQVTFHDPCYLGRHQQVFDEPRAVIDASGASRVEMARAREASFCCGAGGGRMFLEEEVSQRVNLVRADEAIATGSEVISTACPYCRIMLDDAVQSRGAAERVEVLDFAELLVRSLAAEPPARR